MGGGSASRTILASAVASAVACSAVRTTTTATPKRTRERLPIYGMVCQSEQLVERDKGLTNRHGSVSVSAGPPPKRRGCVGRAAADVLGGVDF